MRLCLWGINYAPELTGIGVYNASLAEYLRGQGDEVTVVTSFPYYPSWRKRPEDAQKVFSSERLADVVVHRCWHYVPARPSTARRILHELTFVIASALKVLLLPAPDVYLVVSPPLLLGLFAVFLARIKNAPFVFHIQDLQPDAAAGLGMLKPSPFLALLYRMEAYTYGKALAVSVISEEMRSALVGKGVPPAKLIYCPNWIDTTGAGLKPAPGSWLSSRALSQYRHLVSYAGNMGNKQGLEIILEAARLLASRQNILFVIAGDGAKKEELQMRARELCLVDVRFEPVLSEAEHTSLLSDSALCIITQKPGTGAAFVPSKLLKILALGRPVITNAEPESALGRAVQEYGFGLLVAPDDARALAAAVEELIDSDQTRSRMSENGRDYVSRFQAQRVLPEFRAELTKRVAASRAD